MKILFVTFLYEPSLGGGASQVVHSLANGLSAQGHEVLVVSPEGLLQGWIGKLAENHSLIMRPYQTLRASSSSHVQLASSPSQQLLSAHQRMAFFREAVCQVIPNSHGFCSKELAELRSIDLPKPFNPLRLLFLGRLVPEKGIDQLCQAVTALNKDRCDVVLELAGWGDYLGTLKERYGNCANIHFRGPCLAMKRSVFCRKVIY